MLRSLLVAGALVLGTGAVQAADCASIPDSLLRLRCYDAAAKDGGSAQPAPGAKPEGFEAYRARPYSGPVRLPSFKGPTKEYAMFRTRIRDGMRAGPNFAGHLALIQFGCGTGCSVVLVGDVANGSVGNFPIGGEDAQGLSLDFRRDSDLVVAQWQEGDRCRSARYRWTGAGFDRLSGKDLGPAKVCWESN